MCGSNIGDRFSSHSGGLVADKQRQRYSPWARALLSTMLSVQIHTLNI